jgi:hypothetical protein
MSLVNIASDSVTASVIGRSIIRPLVGVWTADLEIDQPDGSGFAAGTAVTITSQDGYELKGVVAEGRSGDFLDTVHVRVLGGAGGMAKTVTARSFVQPGAFVSDVLNALCGDSGETLSSTIDPAFLNTNLAAWSIKAEPMSRALETLIRWVAPSMSWRILEDGTLWIGNETWPSADVDYILLSQDPKDASYILGLHSPAIDPGTTVDGIGKVSRVEISVTADAIRAHVLTPVDDDPDRSSNADQAAFIAQKVSYVDYYAMYVCQIVSQSGDMSTVDITPVTARNQEIIGGLQRIPARYLTGTKVQVAPGATCLLGWDGGDPQGPFALIMSGDSALKVAVSATSVDIEATADAKLGGATTTVQATAGMSISGATLTASSSGPAALKGATTTLGNNPIVTPVLTVGAFDFMGIPIAPSPTNTGTVLAG